METLTQIAVGGAFAVGFSWLVERLQNYRGQKNFYAAGLIIAALIYVGFGMRADSYETALAEMLGVLLYLPFAVLGVLFSGWLLSLGWALHALWDVLLHDRSTAFVPHWYPMFCLGFDLLLAARIGWREWRIR